MVGEGEKLKVLDSFHHQLSRRVMGMMSQSTMGGEGGCPSVAEALETSGIWTIKEYIKQKQDTIAV